MSDNSISDNEDSDDNYSENESKSNKNAEGNSEVRGSRTNCKGHWSKEEVILTS